MARTRLIIEENEKNKILKMYGIQKTPLNEQNVPPFNFTPGRIITLQRISPTLGTPMDYRIRENNTNNLLIQVPPSYTLQYVFYFTDPSKTMMTGRRPGNLYRIIKVSAASTPPTTRRPTPTPTPSPTPGLQPQILPITIPTELTAARIDLFKCPDYDPANQEPDVPSIKITKMEEVLPAGVGEDMTENIGRYIKITTDRPILATKKPLILYFICDYDGFATNHDGSDIDNFNVLVRKFDGAGGKTPPGCDTKRDLQKPTEKASPEMKKIEITNPPTPKPPSLPMTENNGGTNSNFEPTRVFSNQLHNFLQQKYCGLTWTKSRGKTGEEQAV